MPRAGDRSGRLRFGVFEVDLRTGELTKRGRRLRLQEQPFRLLAVLLDRPGELVSREDLHDRLWPDTTVDFDHGLNKAISKLREVLGDSAESPRFIETVARRGYRFLADVALVDPGRPEIDAGEPQMSRRDGGALSPRWPARLPSGRLIALALVLLLVTSLGWFLYPWKHAEAKISSLAVLPLVDLSGNASQDYLADGLTDELISRLGEFTALRVISRTSVMTYKSVRRPLPQIARELNVDAVVEGSVLRSGDQVRINVELIWAPADRHIWGGTYAGDLRDTLALQGRVARAIAQQIRATLNLRQQAAPETSKTVNPEAFEDYLKGRYFLNKRTGIGLKTAIAYFNQAIQADRNFAEAYSGLADAYALSGDWEYGVIPPQMAFVKAKTAATKAMALDDSLGEAHTSLAFALDLYAWDWAAAEKEYKRAIELSPGYATAHLWYAWHLIVTGRGGEGVAELKKAQSLDPLSLIIGADLADALCIAHRYDDSVRQSRKTLELDPNFAVAHYELGQALAQKHSYADAISEFQKAIALSGHSDAFDSNLAYVYAVSGRPAEARKIAADLASRNSLDPSADAHVALIHVGLGEHDEAMAWLNKAYAARFNPSILLRPAWDPLRPDARFKGLLRRIGIPG